MKTAIKHVLDAARAVRTPWADVTAAAAKHYQRLDPVEQHKLRQWDGIGTTAEFVSAVVEALDLSRKAARQAVSGV